VEGQPRAAEHERVIPQPERESVYVTQIARVCPEYLTDIRTISLRCTKTSCGE